jgi:hypothetical protein
MSGYSADTLDRIHVQESWYMENALLNNFLENANQKY